MKAYINNQQGFAIPIVLALLMILMILGVSAMSMANNQTKMVSIHQQREKALQFAEAGIHHYMAELSVDPTFYTSIASTNMQNTEIDYKDPEDKNKVIGKYKITSSEPDINDPYVYITSTGWLKDSDFKRTVRVKLQKKDLLQNAITTNTGSDVLWYTKRYIRGDRIYGPLHVNGDLVVNGKVGDAYDEGEAGPRFYGKVTYSGKYTKETGISWFVTDTTWFDPILNPGPKDDEPEKVAPTGMLSMNDSLKLEADSQHTFVGRTCIYLDGTDIWVRNKNDSERRQISFPDNGIIYVKGKTGNNKWGLDTANVFVSGTLDGRLTIAAENDIYITGTDPTNWDKPSSTDPPGEGTHGGLFYESLKDEDFTPENATELLADCDDMLGLVANRNVRILRYNWPKIDGNYYWIRPFNINYVTAPYDMTIHAVISAVTGAFEYEDNRLSGDKRGELIVVGSVMQNRTGALAGYSVNLYDFQILPDFVHDRLSGYGRTFVHDPRLMYESPPRFVGPENSGWEMVEWQEVSNPD